MNAYSVDFFTLLKDDTLRPLFEAWLRDDFSYENYAFWKDVEEYKQIEDPDLMHTRAQEIFDRYFALGSEWEINADHYQKIELRERIKVETTKEIFDDIQISIFVLMRMDSYPKFMESDRFLEHQGISRPREPALDDDDDDDDDHTSANKPPRKSGFLSCLSG